MNHDAEINEHHDRIQKQGSHRLHKRGGDFRIARHPGLDITGHALREEVDRQLQDLPDICGRTDRIEFSVDFKRIDGTDPLYQQLQKGEGRKHREERDCPGQILALQEIVDKDLGECRLNQIEQRCDDCRQHDKDDRGPGVLQALCDVGKHTCRFAFRNEGFRRFKAERDAGKAAVEFFHRNFHGSAGGVVQDGFLLSGKAVQYDKMIKIPVNDAREKTFLLDAFQFEPVTVGFQSVGAGSLQDIQRI